MLERIDYDNYKLNKPCPLCGGQMSWCGDQDPPETDNENIGHHDCHIIECCTCEYSVDFYGPAYNEEDWDKLLTKIAEKWNG